MQRYTIEHDGNRYVVEAEDEAQALAFVMSQGARRVEEAPPNPYRDAARADYERVRELGLPVDGNLPTDLARLGVQGASLGLADEFMAGLGTPIEMYRRGTFNPVEGYRYAKAAEDLALEQTRARQGLLGTAAEAVGGVGSGIGIARAVQAMPQAVTRAGRIGQALLGGNRASANPAARIGTMAGSGALYGGLTGAAEGEGVEDRLSGATQGAVVGGVLGGALQTAGEVGKGLFGWVGANLDPRGYAGRQVARGVDESGRSVRDISDEVARAARDGQPFTVADAMGDAGQRQLRVVARNPGEGRTQAVEFLEGRQLDAPRRVSGILADGFDAPDTAAARREAMIAARRQTADAAYGAARREAGAVNLSRAIQMADDYLRDTPPIAGAEGFAQDSVAGAVRRARAFLVNRDRTSQLTDFQRALRAKIEIDGMMESARQGGAVYNQLRPIRNAIDDALADASDPYAAARDAYRRDSQAIDALDVGRASARVGRFEDTIPRFERMTPEEQRAFRVGYADYLIDGVQQRAGGNAARPFSAQSFREEFPVFAAPGRADDLLLRMNREDVMARTANMALGGSPTTDILADNAAMAVNPEIVTNILGGNWGQAARNVFVRSADTLGGNTPAVRRELANILLRAGSDPNLAATLQAAARNEQTLRTTLAALIRGGMAGTGAATNNVQAQPRQR